MSQHLPRMILLLVAVAIGAGCGSSNGAASGVTVDDGSDASGAAEASVTLSGVAYDVAAVGTVDYVFPPPKSVDELVEASELIVRGVARDVEMHAEDAVTPVTVQTFEVTELVAGDAAVGEAIDVVLLGGVLDGEGSGQRVFQEMEDEPQFETGEEYLLVLRRGPDGMLKPVGPAAGRYKVVDETLLDRDVDLTAEGVAGVDPSRSEGEMMTEADPHRGELLSGMSYERAIDEIRAAK